MARKKLPAKEDKSIIAHSSHDVRMYLILCYVNCSSLLRFVCAKSMLALIPVLKHSKWFMEYWKYGMARLLGQVKELSLISVIQLMVYSGPETFGIEAYVNNI